MNMKAFTFVEVVVTIAIITLIVTGSTYFYISAQSSARNTTRKSDLAQIQLALETYKADFNAYPESFTSLTNGSYIASIPGDPGAYVYDYVGLDNETGLNNNCGSSCKTYRLMAKLEDPSQTCGDGYGSCDGPIPSCNYCLSPYGRVDNTDSDGDGIPDDEDQFPTIWSGEPCDEPPTITGTSGHDNIIGTTGDDVIHTLEGNDFVNGNGGNDIICTLDGNDSITTGNGNDAINANGGNNNIDSGDGNNYITTGDANQQIITGDGNDVLITLGGNLSINVGNGDNYVSTGIGNDNITSGDGNDEIHAGDGANTVNSNGGNDIVTAGSGNDSIDGGLGIDTCDADGGNNNNVVNCEN